LAFEREDIQYKPEKDYETLLLEGKELLSTFHQKIPEDEGEIIGIEQAFHFWLHELPVPIIGSFDLLLKDAANVLTVVDHKTSGKSYSNQDVDKNFQLTVYNLAAKLNGFNAREILLRFDVLIKTKTPKFEQFYSTRSESEERKAIKKILAVYEGIQKGVFIPNDSSWKCNGCAFKNACENWFAGGNDHEQD
jgi:putative RecB family exonuclease